MNTLIVSESHRYDEKRQVVIYTNDDTTKPYNDILVKIDIYHARVFGWFFNVVDEMVKNGQHPGDYIAIMVALSYLEGVEQFRKGKETPIGRSGEWFKDSAKRVFKDQSDNIIDRLWKETRCGLFHSGFPNGKIYLSHGRSKAIEVEKDEVGNDCIHINPKLFLNEISCDFNKYISDLKDLDPKLKTMN